MRPSKDGRLGKSMHVRDSMSACIYGRLALITDVGMYKYVCIFGMIFAPYSLRENIKIGATFFTIFQK